MLHGAHASDLRQQVDRVLAQPSSDDTYDDRLALSSGSVLLAFAGQDADRARLLARRAAEGGRLLDDEAEGTGLYLAAGALTWTSSFEESERLLTDAIERAQVRGATSTFASASSSRGFARVYMGMVTEAVLDFEAALSPARPGLERLPARRPRRTGGVPHRPRRARPGRRAPRRARVGRRTRPA